MSQHTAPPPGFYDDGSGEQRWWDGSEWTEHRQGHPKSDGKSVAIVGYVLAVVVPLLGLLYGLVLVAVKNQRAWNVVRLAVAVFLAEVVIGMLIAGLN